MLGKSRRAPILTTTGRAQASVHRDRGFARRLRGERMHQRADRYGRAFRSLAWVKLEAHEMQMFEGARLSGWSTVR
jgi:hypothetical protein